MTAQPYPSNAIVAEMPLKANLRGPARLALLFAIAAAAAAQTPPADIEGWDKIHWGMTLDQVRALYPAAETESDQFWTHLKLPAVQVGDIPLQVHASARKPAATISLVALTCYFGLPGNAAAIAPRDFDTLKTALLRKYGAHRDESHAVEYGDPTHTFLWVFPSGAIELKLTRKRAAPNLGSFRIEYRAATAGPL